MCAPRNHTCPSASNPCRQIRFSSTRSRSALIASPCGLRKLGAGQVEHAADVRAAQPHRPVGCEPLPTDQPQLDLRALDTDRVPVRMVERAPAQIELPANARAAQAYRPPTPEAAAEVEGALEPEPVRGQPPVQVAAPQADRWRVRLGQVDRIPEVALVELQRADQRSSAQVQRPDDPGAAHPHRDRPWRGALLPAHELPKQPGPYRPRRPPAAAVGRIVAAGLPAAQVKHTAGGGRRAQSPFRVRQLPFPQPHTAHPRPATIPRSALPAAQRRVLTPGRCRRASTSLSWSTNSSPDTSITTRSMFLPLKANSG